MDKKTKIKLIEKQLETQRLILIEIKEKIEENIKETTQLLLKEAKYKKGDKVKLKNEWGQKIIGKIINVFLTYPEQLPFVYTISCSMMNTRKIKTTYICEMKEKDIRLIK